MRASQTFDCGTLVDGGGDLNSGMLEYVWDVLYVVWFVQVMGLTSSYAWLVLLVIPAFALWRLWWDLVKPWIFNEGMFAKPEIEESKTQRKRRARAEKHGGSRFNG